MEFEEGDYVILRAEVARSNEEQSLIQILSMEGPYTLRVPNSQLFRVKFSQEEM